MKMRNAALQIYYDTIHPPDHELWTQRGEYYVRSFKKGPWITCSLSCRNKGETVPPHTEILFYSRLCVLPHVGPQIMVLKGFALSSAKSEKFFSHTWKKKNAICDARKTSRGLCLCSCGSKRDSKIIKSDKLSGRQCWIFSVHLYCIPLCFVYFLKNVKTWKIRFSFAFLRNTKSLEKEKHSCSICLRS